MKILQQPCKTIFLFTVHYITKVEDFTITLQDNLPVYSSLKPPDKDRKNLDKWLNTFSLETPEIGDELLKFIGLQNQNDIRQLKDWIVNGNEVKDWADAAMLAKALRNATVHGLLSPTKVEEWGMKSAMEILVENLGHLVVFGLKTLASPLV